MDHEKPTRTKPAEKKDDTKLAFLQGMVHALYSIGFGHKCSRALGNEIRKRMKMDLIPETCGPNTPNMVRVKLSEISPNVSGYDGSDPESELKGLDAGLKLVRDLGSFPGNATGVRTSLQKKLKKNG